jgi:hypothetical protein
MMMISPKNKKIMIFEHSRLIGIDKMMIYGLKFIVRIVESWRISDQIGLNLLCPPTSH